MDVLLAGLTSFSLNLLKFEEETVMKRGGGGGGGGSGGERENGGGGGGEKREKGEGRRLQLTFPCAYWPF